jgi:hypothetical protein
VAKNEYHFVITLQFRKEGELGNFANTVSGTIAARRGETRQSLYRRALEDASKALGAQDPVTLFFDLAPNDL